ncbi:MAG: APC family permease, partial [Chloroflexi bacterium]|nr:APC family permease [Chloroflexota bacterium]
TYTAEGGPYVWARLAFGRPVASVSALLYWVSNPVWLGGTLTVTAVTAIGTFFTPLQGASRYAASLLFIWLTVLAAVLSLRVGKWIPAIGAWTRLIVLPFFTFSVIFYAARHGVHGFPAREFAPTYAAFIAVVPVLFFNYLGFELPSTAGEEMKSPERDVPFAVLRSAIGSLLLYGVPVLSILLVLPEQEVTGLSGFLDAIKVVFTVYGGHVAAGGKAVLTGAGSLMGGVTCIAFILALASSGVTWIMGADRAQAVAALDGGAPRFMGTFSRRFGTPIAVNVISGCIATAVMVIATTLAHGDSNRYFQAVLGLAISTTTISYLAIFPAFIRLRYIDPQTPRPYRAPGGLPGVWVCGSLSTVWALLATAGLLWPGIGVGWFGTKGNPDDSLPTGFSHLRAQYELTQVVPLVLLLGVGLLFYRIGRKTREELPGQPPSAPVPGVIVGEAAGGRAV